MPAHPEHVTWKRGRIAVPRDLGNPCYDCGWPQEEWIHHQTAYIYRDGLPTTHGDSLCDDEVDYLCHPFLDVVGSIPVQRRLFY